MSVKWKHHRVFVKTIKLVRGFLSMVCNLIAPFSHCSPKWSPQRQQVRKLCSVGRNPFVLRSTLVGPSHHGCNQAGAGGSLLEQSETDLSRKQHSGASKHSTLGLVWKLSRIVPLAILMAREAVRDCSPVERPPKRWSSCGLQRSRDGLGLLAWCSCLDGHTASRSGATLDHCIKPIWSGPICTSNNERSIIYFSLWSCSFGFFLAISYCPYISCSKLKRLLSCRDKPRGCVSKGERDWFWIVSPNK